MARKQPAAGLVRLCDEALATLGALGDRARTLPRWSPRLRPDAFWFLRAALRVADAALARGAPEHFERLRRLCESPYDAAESRYRVTELIAAIAACRRWALKRRKSKRADTRRQAPAPRPSARAPRRALPTSPGRRLRGGREILEAMEGVYTYARWRAFKREALNHGAPVEWPPKGGQPRAYANILRAWLAARAEAAELAREERERRDVERALEASARSQRAYTGGDDQALGIVKRPSGRRTR